MDTSGGTVLEAARAQIGYRGAPGAAAMARLSASWRRRALHAGAFWRMAPVSSEPDHSTTDGFRSAWRRTTAVDGAESTARQVWPIAYYDIR